MRQRNGSKAAAAGLLVVVAVTAAVAVILVNQHRKSSSPGAGSPSPTTSRPAVSIKPSIQGLIDRSAIPPAALRSAVTAWVVNVPWSALQPSSGDALVSPNAIDTAITQTLAANKANPSHPLRIKIRLTAGVDAPDWVKHLPGGPITIKDPLSGKPQQVGPFWTDAFGQAYDRLQRLLAAKYDNVPELAEITISRCTTVYAEPFVRQIADPANALALAAAGYTAEADQQCQREEIQSHQVWQHTNSGLALNPFQADSNGHRRTDETFTQSMMTYCRSVLGQRCVLENNSIRWPPVAGPMAEMYASMSQLGPPISFQTAAPKRVGDLVRTLAWAAEVGANAVELPFNYTTDAETLLASAAHQLRMNPTVR